MKTSLPLLLLGLISISLNAQIFVDQNATGSNDGSSWTNAYTNLQTAIDMALIDDQLWVAAGVYKPSINIEPDSNYFLINKKIEIYGGFFGNESNINERDWNTNFTILSGDINGDDLVDDFSNSRDDNALHVLLIEAFANGSIVDGFTIQNGQAKLTDAPTSSTTGPTNFNDWSAGGILVEAPMEIKNCTITQCSGYLGGAILIRIREENADEVLLENCLIERNQGEFGMFSIYSVEKGLVKNCTIRENNSVAYGSGLVLGNTNCKVEDCLFEGNRCSEGPGSIFIFQNSNSDVPSSFIEISRTNFISNTATDGAGITFNNFFSGSQISIDSCEFKNNRVLLDANSGGLAGAILLRNLEDTSSGVDVELSATISNSLIEGHEAIFGGGAYFFSSDDGFNIDINNTTFKDNIGQNFGGGVVVGNTLANFNHCSFENNSTSNIGGGIMIFHNSLNLNSEPTTNIINSSFFANQASAGGGICFNNFYPGSKIKVDSCQFNKNVSDENEGVGGAMLLQNIGSQGVLPSLSIDIGNSFFAENISAQGGGLEVVALIDTVDLKVTNTEFIKNQAAFGGGLNIINDGAYVSADIFESTFRENVADNFGGGLSIFSVNNISIKKSKFSENSAFNEGSAITARGNSRLSLETVLLIDNLESQAIFNEDSLWMKNVTMIDNNAGLLQTNDAYAQLQNNIFNNSSRNYVQPDQGTVDSKGGNISSDNSFSTLMMGYQNYNDYHETDPLLDAAYSPEANSPAIDAGNPNGVTLEQDLEDNDRIRGLEIDAGAFESAFSVSTNNVSEIDIKIYPNPFTDVIHISDLTEIQDLSLLDANGRIIMRLPKEESIYIDKALPAGTYFMQVKIKNENIIFKLDKV